MTIEQRLAEIIRALCADALSSTVNLNVDPDVVLAVLAQALLAALRARLPGYATVTPDTLQRRFLETPGTIINHGDTITVRLERRAYAPSYATPTSPPRPPSPAGTTQGPGKSPFAPNARTCLSLKSGSRPGPMRSRGAGPRRGAIGQTGTNRDFAEALGNTRPSIPRPYQYFAAGDRGWVPVVLGWKATLSQVNGSR